VGWVLASPDLTDSIRKVHDFLTVGAAAPLQQAGVVALGLGNVYYAHLAAEYIGRRDHIVESLRRAGLRPFVPRGAYYVIADISSSGISKDIEFVRNLVRNVGVAAVPGSSFYSQNSTGSEYVRFCFCKKYETLKVARQKLEKLNSESRMTG